MNHDRPKIDYNIHLQVFAKYVSKWISIACPFQGDFLFVMPFALIGKCYACVFLCLSVLIARMYNLVTRTMLMDSYNAAGKTCTNQDFLCY